MPLIPDIDAFYRDLDPYGPELVRLARAALERRDTRIEALNAHLARLPRVRPSRVALDRDWITIGRPEDLDGDQRASLQDTLYALKPWRKGPFDLFGIRIDSEWDSSLKWARLVPFLGDLAGRRVLDVGSSNGYYLFRATAARPNLILGIEPYPVYFYQFLTLQHFLPRPGLYNLPLRLEQLPAMPDGFDLVFCMGILYHRRSPLDTLAQMHALLTKGGCLILETLIIEGDDPLALSPHSRYARMRNVFFIPTVACLTNWLVRSGFDDIRCRDITPTTAREQRKTPWIDSDSLDSFIDPDDRRRTVEGYPAPVRAMVTAIRT